MRQFDNALSVLAAAVPVTMLAAALLIDPGKAVTLGTTLRLTGTSPAVTIAAGSGSLAYATNPPAIKITIEAGAVTFKISYDGGQSDDQTGVSIPAGGSFTVPGGKAAAGNIISFPAGSYVATDTYISTVASLTTSDTNAFVLAQAVAATQLGLGKDANGYHLLPFGAQYLESTAAGLLALSANDPALTVMCKVAPGNLVTTQDIAGWCQTGGTNGQRRIELATTGTGRLAAITINDSGASTNTNKVRGIDDQVVGTASKFCWFWAGGGGNVSCTVNDLTPNPNAVAWAPGTTVTHGRFSIGATHANTVARPMLTGGKIYKFVAFASAAGAADRTAWNAIL